MSQRISGASFDVDLNGEAIHFDSFTLDITDNSKAASKNGRPDGWLKGDVAAAGEVVVDRVELKKLKAAAAKAGSWQDMETFDINAFGSSSNSDDNIKVEAFGCKLKMSKVLEADPTKVDKAQWTLPFEVTSADFVTIDGVPYVK